MSVRFCNEDDCDEVTLVAEDKVIQCQETAVNSLHTKTNWTAMVMSCHHGPNLGRAGTSDAEFAQVTS